MIVSNVTWSGKPAVLACDGNCGKAWGIQCRPKMELSENPDDIYYLADGELGEAPADPGTYEGGHGKPAGAHHNKWCARECERGKSFDPGEPVELPDFSRRLYNQPWKHPEAIDDQPLSSPLQSEVMAESYTVQEAYDRAKAWCTKHPGWKPIADIDDSDSLYKTWDELSQRQKAPWVREYGRSAEDAWREFGERPCKVKFGFISGAGLFYSQVTAVPTFHNYMMVFQVEKR